jgi:uncharacterized protein YcbK (DUF882 family)
VDEYFTPHFTYREMTRSYLAQCMGIDNTPGPREVACLRLLCERVLEPLRAHVGPVIISSGYRCPRLNELVGGVANSQHLRGQAADIHCESLSYARHLYDYIRRHLPYDQLLLERRFTTGTCWLHVSYSK